MNRLSRITTAYARFCALALTLLWPATSWAQGTTPPVQTPTQTIVLFGDSIAAGYGLAPDETIEATLIPLLEQSGLHPRFINAGVSGDTTRGGLERIDWAINGDADLVIVILGGNDALRAFDPSETERNLDAIAGQLLLKDTKVLIAGMQAPPNLGPDYGERFNAIFPAVAARHDVDFYPFILEGVAADLTLNQEDGIHPNPEGARIIANGLAPFIVDILKPVTRTTTE